MGKKLEALGLGLKFLMEWVPVETGLPDEEIEVMVYSERHDALEFAHLDGGNWYDRNDAMVIDVSHWTHVEVPR